MTNQTKDQATPRPWEIKLYHQDEINIVSCIDGQYRSIADIVGAMPIDMENARLIVKAVNCHDELVEALKEAKKAINEQMASCGESDILMAPMAVIEQALAKAESGDL